MQVLPAPPGPRPSIDPGFAAGGIKIDPAVLARLHKLMLSDPGFGGQGRSDVGGQVATGSRLAPQPPQPRLPGPLAQPFRQPPAAHPAQPGISAGQYASNQLQRLQQMGIDPYQFEQPAEPGHGQDLAALWRQVSPIMGALIQARAGIQPAANLAQYPDAIQQVIAQALQSSQAAPPSPLPRGPVSY